MRAKRVNENINFERGNDPKSAMGVGLEGKLKQLKGERTNKSDWDDEFILYVFKKDYKKWLRNQGRVTPENVEIWSDSTSGGASIIKWKSPASRETTMLRWESAPGPFRRRVEALVDDPEIKQEIADQSNKNDADPAALARIISSSADRKDIWFENWQVREYIAERLIDLLQ